jgi:hypothetical protein
VARDGEHFNPQGYDDVIICAEAGAFANNIAKARNEISRSRML